MRMHSLRGRISQMSCYVWLHGEMNADSRGSHMCSTADLNPMLWLPSPACVTQSINSDLVLCFGVTTT